MKKVKSILSIVTLLCVTSSVTVLFTGCSSTNKNSNNNLIISTLDEETKGNIISFNIDSNTEKILIKDKDVGITGDQSSDGAKIAYADALGDTDPWQIYLSDVNNNKTSKATTDNFGKSHAKIANDNSIYFLTGTKYNNVKIAKINPETKSYSIIDEDNEDRWPDAFDVKDDKFIMSACSNSLNSQKFEENKGHYVPIVHSIYESDLNNKDLKEIGQIQASSIESISLNYGGKKAIIGGVDINGDLGYGIYEFSIDTGVITKILTDDIIKNMENSIVGQISHPPLATISKDDKLIYFVGTLKNSKSVNISGLNSYPASIFSYNINTKEFKEVFTPSVSSMISDLNIKY